MENYELQKKRIWYRVGRGESVIDIARSVSVSPTKLIRDNNLFKDVMAGELLLIETGMRTYTVSVEDTAATVEYKTGVRVDRLLLDNGADYLFCGLVLEY